MWIGHVVQALLAAKQSRDPHGWQQFEQDVQNLKLQRTRTLREVDDIKAALLAAQQSQGISVAFSALYSTGEPRLWAHVLDSHSCVSSQL